MQEASYAERCDIANAIGGVVDALSHLLWCVNNGYFIGVSPRWRSSLVVLDMQIARSLGVDALRACEQAPQKEQT